MNAISDTKEPVKRDSKQDDPEVILKGENHTSRADLQEEIELLQNGVDALVLEGNEDEAEYRMTEGWFQQALNGMFYVLSPLYLSKETIVQLAKFQGADVYFTRESDAEVLRNAPRLLRWFSAMLYFILLPSSVIVGLLSGYLEGAVFLLISFTIPVLTLRIYNTHLNQGEKNRDRIMAKKIKEAADESCSVLAIVGDDHAEGISTALPDELDVKYHPTQAGGLSLEGVWEFSVRGFQVFSLLFTLYLAILWMVVNFALPLI